MSKRSVTEANNDLWLLFGDVYHQLVLVRQRELTQYNIPVRQLHALRTLQALGSGATISDLSKIMGRKPNVISRQVVRMENDGLIKRIKNKPKSNQLSLELTQKGLDILKISTKSKENTIDSVFAFLSVEDRQKIESIFNTVLIRLREYIPEQL